MSPSGVAVFLAAGPMDLRGSFDRLAAVTRQVLRLDPASGALFLFVNRHPRRPDPSIARVPHSTGCQARGCADALPRPRQRAGSPGKRLPDAAPSAGLGQPPRGANGRFVTGLRRHVVSSGSTRTSEMS